MSIRDRLAVATLLGGVLPSCVELAQGHSMTCEELFTATNEGTDQGAATSLGFDRLVLLSGSDSYVAPGDTGADLVFGGDGNNNIIVRGGDDVVCGGAGDDTIRGGSGNDWLHGEDGNDQLRGQSGTDRLFGGSGDDFLRGGGDDDELYGQSDSDDLHGALGNDLVMGGQGADILNGAGNVDECDGSPADTTVTGCELSVTAPAGSVMPFAGSSPPPGWLLCNGDSVAREDYFRLFLAIGNAHGTGDDATSFRTPDYRGRFLRGVDAGAGRDLGASQRVAMREGGSCCDNVGSIQGDAFESHTHPVVNRFGPPPHGSPLFMSDGSGKSYDKLDTAGFGGPVDRGTLATAKPDSGNIDAETRPKNAYVNWIIKY